MSACARLMQRWHLASAITTLAAVLFCWSLAIPSAEGWRKLHGRQLSRRLQQYTVNNHVQCAYNILGHSSRLPRSTTTYSKWPFLPQVYLTHYTRHSTSPGRLNWTLSWLDQFKVKPAVIKDFDREDLKDDHVTCFNPATHTEKYSPCPSNKVQVGAVSLAIKHFKAFFDMIQNGYPYALILEDDLRVCDVFKDNMTEVFHSIIKSQPATWDIILLGTWNCGWHDTCYKQVNSTQFTYQFKWQNLQATHAYLISLPGVFRMFNSLPLRCPVDVQMDRHLSKSEIVTVYPPVFYQDRTIANTGVRDVFDTIPRPHPNYTAPKW